jgi:hypothetical protein
VCNPAFTATSGSSYAYTAATAGCYQSNWTQSLALASTTTVTITGLVNGSWVDIEALQDASGGNTITMAAISPSCTWRVASGGGFVASTTPALTAAATKASHVIVHYDGANCDTWVNQ